MREHTGVVYARPAFVWSGVDYAWEQEQRRTVIAARKREAHDREMVGGNTASEARGIA